MPESIGRDLLLSDPVATGPEEPQTEQDFHHAFLAQAFRDPESFARAAPEILLDDAPTCRKVACLRVLDETRSPVFESAFALALGAPADGSNAHGVSLPEFAVQYLGERAGRDPAARSVLLEAIFGALRLGAPDLRARAAAHVARTASELELHRLAGLVPAQEDPLFLQSFASALAENPETATVDLLFPGLVGPREPVAMEVD